MKEVYATNNEVEIQMLVGLLESQGIFTQVHADGAGGYLRVQGADFNIFKRVVVRDEDWSRALSIAKENGFENKKNTTKNYTCFINIVNIDMQFKGYVLVIKSRRKADFLLCGGGDTFCLQSFCRLICNMSISLRRSVNE